MFLLKANETENQKSETKNEIINIHKCALQTGKMDTI